MSWPNSTSDHKILAEKTNALLANVSGVIKGVPEIILLTVTCLFSRGHVLFQSVPGTGKSILAETIARSIKADNSDSIASFKRVQGTPDLMPSDITGTSIYNPKTKQFEPRLGPIVTANIFLFDESNRTQAKIHSAVLEAMEHRTVTIDGVSHHLPELFLTLATQNPIEQEGTFILAEAMLDRFMMRLILGYPNKEAELEILASQRNHHPIHDLKPVISVGEILAIQEALTRKPSEGGSMYMDPLVERYIVDIVNATRVEAKITDKKKRMLDWGSSTRGTLALFNAGRAYAFMQNRDFVKPEDIQAIAVPTLAHRVGINMRVVRLEADVKSAEEAIEIIVRSVPTPEKESFSEPQIRF